MKVRLALLASVVLALAVPVGASAHPVECHQQLHLRPRGRQRLAHAELGRPGDDGGANFTKTPNMRLQGFFARPPGAPNAFGAFHLRPRVLGPSRLPGHVQRLPHHRHQEPAQSEAAQGLPECANLTGAGQGDVVVWGSILVRSWDSNNTLDSPRVTARWSPRATAGAPPTLGNGFEGVHVFDVSDPGNPDLVASVDLKCGSHTASGVPDLRNRRLIVYSTPSNAACEGIDIVEVPLSRPEEAEARQLRVRRQHDTGHAGEQLRVPRHRGDPRPCEQGRVRRWRRLRGLEHRRQGRWLARQPAVPLPPGGRRDQGPGPGCTEREQPDWPLGGVLVGR